MAEAEETSELLVTETTVPKTLTDSSEISTVHLSFIVNLLLPHHVISSDRQKRLVDDAIMKINERGKMMYGDEDPPSFYVPVGSSAELYAIPQAVWKDPSNPLEAPRAVHYSDIDMLVVWNISEPLRELDLNPPKKQKIIIETDIEELHPGYCRLFVNDPEAVLRGVDSSTALTVNERFYLNAEKVRKDLELVHKQSALETFPIDIAKMIIDMKGPAIGIEDMRARTLKLLEAHKSRGMDHSRQEFVAALPIIWPKIANEWRKRKRNNDWLTDELATRIVAGGCHVVPVAHRHSKHPEVEWRLSFATSEVALSKEAVTCDQRRCYLYLKLLRQEIAKHSNLLSSYHFKTAFLYSCERLPIPSWKEDAGRCVLYVIDTLVKFVRDRWLPSYFLPCNNLLDHLTDAEFSEAENILMSLRIDPITPILEFTDRNIIGNQSTVLPFRKAIQPVLEDMQVVNIQANMAPKAFIYSHILFISALILDDKAEDAVKYAESMFHFLDSCTEAPVSSFSKNLASLVMTCKFIYQKIRFFEIALDKFSDVHPEVAKLTGNLGCLYHALSCRYPRNSSQYNQATNKAREYFDMSEKNKRQNCSDKIHFALFLLDVDHVNGCLQILSEVIEQEEENTETLCIFDATTSVTLEKKLYSELATIMGESQIVQIPPLPLAYYLRTIIEYRRNGMQERLKEYIDKFYCFCKKHGTFISFYILGILLKTTKLPAKAEECFHKAHSIQENKICLLNEKASHTEHLLMEGKSTEAIAYVIGLSLDGFGDRGSLFNSIMFHFSSIQYALEFSEMAIEHLEKDEGTSCFFDVRGNIACFYFSAAFEYDPDSENYLVSMVKADTLFDVFLSENSETATTIDYANFLYNQKRFTEAIDILEKSSDVKGLNSYGVMEYNAVPKILQKEIDIHTKIEAASKAFGYFILIACLTETQASSQKIKQVKTEFKTYCSQTKTSRVYALLGYSELLTENWFLAEDCFCKAVELAWDYTAAKQNIALCRSKRSSVSVVNDKYEEKYVPLGLVPELRGEPFSQ